MGGRRVRGEYGFEFVRASPAPFALNRPGGGGDTALRAWTLKAALGRAYEREWRGLGARGLGAGPPRPPAPRAAPVPASPAPFALNRPGGGEILHSGHGP